MNWNVMGSMTVTIISVLIFAGVCFMGADIFIRGNKFIAIIIFIIAIILHVALVSWGINHFLL